MSNLAWKAGKADYAEYMGIMVLISAVPETGERVRRFHTSRMNRTAGFCFCWHRGRTSGMLAPRIA